MRNVDVIVPVYKGLEETKACVETYLESCESVDWAQLIVINDCSPEPKLTQWLRETAEKEEFVLLENVENLGFVATVNRGMAENPENDVLLLNSDVEVENDWLHRIRTAAYSRKVGSITPFSNNATICSFPSFCQDNELFLGLSSKELDLYFASLNLEDNLVEVPTGVGFCMYIRRDCLDEVGYFDVETFGKGYGEENDWCQRAAKAGWPNYHQLDVFVYHKGGVSFQDEQDPRKAKALEALRKLHPNYDHDVMTFIQADPARNVRVQALIDLVERTNCPKVLFISHGLGGGVVENMFEIALELKEDACFYLLEPVPKIEGSGLWLKYVTGGDQVVDLLRVDGEEAIGVLLQLLDQLGISHLHYHHVMGCPDFITRLPQVLKCEYTITLHDYYFINGNPTLTDLDGRFVGDNLTRIDNLCIEAYPRKNGLSGQNWRDKYRSFLEGAHCVIMPSYDVERRFKEFYKIPNSQVTYHLDRENSKKIVPESFIKKGKKLKILVIGALGPEKGADLLEDVARRLVDEPIEFHLLGYAYRPLDEKIVQHGKYYRSEFDDQLKSITPDLVWFPALWPETYSYTLSLAMEKGLPIVAPNLGAFPERLADYEEGYLVNWDLSVTDFAKYWGIVKNENTLLNGLSFLPAKEFESANSVFYKEAYFDSVQTGSRSGRGDNISVTLSQMNPSKTNTVGSCELDDAPVIVEKVPKTKASLGSFKSELKKIIKPFREFWGFYVNRAHKICVDSADLLNNTLTITGWVLAKDRCNNIEVILNGKRIGGAAVALSRPDVFQTYRNLIKDDTVGFKCVAKLTPDLYKNDQINELIIHGVCGEKPHKKRSITYTEHVRLYNEKILFTKLEIVNSVLKADIVMESKAVIEEIALYLNDLEVALFYPEDCSVAAIRPSGTPMVGISKFQIKHPLQAIKKIETLSGLKLEIQLQEGRVMQLSNELALALNNQVHVENVFNFRDYTIIQGWALSHKRILGISLQNNGKQRVEAITGLHRKTSESIHSKTYVDSDKSGFLAVLPAVEMADTKGRSDNCISQISLRSIYGDGSSTEFSEVYCKENKITEKLNTKQTCGYCIYFSRLERFDGKFGVAGLVFPDSRTHDDYNNAFELKLHLRNADILTYNLKTIAYPSYHGSDKFPVRYFDEEIVLPAGAESVAIISVCGDMTLFNDKINEESR